MRNDIEKKYFSYTTDCQINKKMFIAIQEPEKQNCDSATQRFKWANKS